MRISGLLDVEFLLLTLILLSRNDLSEFDGRNCNRHGVGSFDEEDEIPRCKRYRCGLFGVVVGDAWWYKVEEDVVVWVSSLL